MPRKLRCQAVLVLGALLALNASACNSFPTLITIRLGPSGSPEPPLAPSEGPRPAPPQSLPPVGVVLGPRPPLVLPQAPRQPPASVAQAATRPPAPRQLDVPRIAQAAPLPPDVKPMDLSLDETDVRKALELISREGKLNLLVSPGVTGRVSGTVKGVSPDQALEAVVRLANLVVRREGGLIFVYTAEEVSRGIGLDRLVLTRVYRLNYVRSADVLSLVRPLLSPRGRATASAPSQAGLRGSVESGGGIPPPGGGTGGAPPAGGATAGTPGGGGGSSGGNSLAGNDVLVVQDHEIVLAQLDYVIASLDQPPPQVEIEASILSVTRTKNLEFGVNFAVLDSTGRAVAVFGNGAALSAIATGVAARTTGAGTGAGTGSSPVILNGPLAADEQGMKLGLVGPPLSAFVRALENTGKVEVLATPHLLVLNKQQASLLLGQRLGYSVVSQSLVSTVQQVQFLDVGTRLNVRPFISDDGLIRMEVHPERSSGVVVNNIPQTSVSEVTTNVMVPDGGTLIIGGLVDEVNNRQQDSTPLLGDLPVLGALFRQRRRQGTKNELVVVLRPRLLPPPPLRKVNGGCGVPQPPPPPALLPFPQGAGTAPRGTP